MKTKSAMNGPMSLPREGRNDTFDILAQCVTELGRIGKDPEEIRAALALALALTCKSSSRHGARAALDDVRNALDWAQRR